MAIESGGSQAKSPTPTALFLETTIHGERVFGARHRKEAIRANVVGKAIGSSTCVLGEFIGTFVKDAAVFRNLLVDSPSTDEAIKRAQNYPYTSRQTARMMYVLAEMAKDAGYEKDDLLDHLEILIEWGLVDRFFEGLIFLSVATGCTKAQAHFVKNEETQVYRPEGLSCSKSQPPQCSIESFLSGNRELLQRIVAGVNNPDLNEMLGVARSLLDSADVPFGRNCQKLKDVLIALESPSDCQIYTTNLRHFEPICAALEKTIYKER
jgi:hypothetical protein